MLSELETSHTKRSKQVGKLFLNWAFNVVYKALNNNETLIRSVFVVYANSAPCVTGTNWS